MECFLMHDWHSPSGLDLYHKIVWSSNFLFFRSLNGGKKIGSIEVSLVNMGEIQNGEADPITTDAQGQKVDNA